MRCKPRRFAAALLACASLAAEAAAQDFFDRLRINGNTSFEFDADGFDLAPSDMLKLRVGDVTN
jgi:hypothetical protein